MRPPRGRDWPVILATLGAAGLARAALGVKSYPFGDDLVYGPLARRLADPSLYPGDAQMDAFANHAFVYAWAWRAAEATIGVAPAFMALTLAISAATALGVLAVMRAVGARGVWAPAALLLGVAVQMRGVGRGDYGGAFTDHFHLQGVAIALALFAFAAVLAHRPSRAGLLLGFGAVVHPALTLHAAFAIGCAGLVRGRRGIGPLIVTAALTAAIALPALLPLALGETGAAPDAPVREVIEKGYLFRAAHHYRIGGGAFLMLALYLGAGLMGARSLGSRGAAGLMIGFGLLGLAAAAFYSTAFDASWRYLSYWPYILDFTRSSPLVWLLGPALALAAVERRSGGGARVAAVAALAAIAILNFDWGPWSAAALAFAAIVAAAPGLLPRVAPLALIGGAAAAALTVARAPMPEPPIDHTRALIAWIRAETPPDALIITPPTVANIREYARRPVWADFRMFSVPQPDQIWLSRKRWEAVTPGFEAAGDLGGWKGAEAWAYAYAAGNTPARIAGYLADMADYFVGFAAAGYGPQEIAAAGLEQVYAGPNYVVFRQARP